jgi:hypothetical protein
MGVVVELGSRKYGRHYQFLFACDKRTANGNHRGNGCQGVNAPERAAAWFGKPFDLSERDKPDCTTRHFYCRHGE